MCVKNARWANTSKAVVQAIHRIVTVTTTAELVLRVPSCKTMIPTQTRQQTANHAQAIQYGMKRNVWHVKPRKFQIARTRNAPMKAIFSNAILTQRPIRKNVIAVRWAMVLAWIPITLVIVTDANPGIMPTTLQQTLPIQGIVKEVGLASQSVDRVREALIQTRRWQARHAWPVARESIQNLMLSVHARYATKASMLTKKLATIIWPALTPLAQTKSVGRHSVDKQQMSVRLVTNPCTVTMIGQHANTVPVAKR